MSLANLEGQIWLDGELVPWNEAKVHVLSYTLHYGMGVFEGIRAYQTPKGPAIFRLQDHTDRLFRSAHIVNMKIAYSKDELNEATRTVIRENGLESAYIRPMCFLDAGSLGLRSDIPNMRVMIAAWNWGAYHGEEKHQKGLKVKISSFSRHHVNSMMCKAKANGNYINSALAIQDAVAGGYDEALMLDTQGFVCEGAAENVFIVRNNTLITPPTTAALEGITRDTIIKLAKDFDIPVLEKSLTRDDVYTADEVFFTGTAVEVTPVREVDNRMIGSGTRGPITQKLQAKYFDIVKGAADNGYEQWLSRL